LGFEFCVGAGAQMQGSGQRGTGQIRGKVKEDEIGIGIAERQRGTGQIREKVKEDEIGIGIAGARSLSSEPGQGGGVANNRANPESRKKPGQEGQVR
jgi:hypothetical protein